MSKNKLLEQQKELGEESITIREKLADGRIRSTQINETRKRLSKIQAEFQANHLKLSTLGIEDEQYVKTSYFEAINTVIEEALNMLDKRVSDVNQLEIASSSKKGEDNIENKNTSTNASLKRKFKRRIKSLQELMDEAHEEIDNNKKSELTITKAEIEENFQAIKKEYANMSNVSGSDEADDEEFEDIAREVRISLKQIIVALEKTEAKSVANSVKLEDIKIPVFFGNIVEWPSFHDLFKNLVHSQHNFSNAEKMYRLKNYVRGEAGRLIQHLKVTDSNYEAAWNILNSRYENKRLLFTTQVDRILDHPMVNTESAFSVKQLLDTTNECVQALKGLNIKIDDAEPFIARIIVRKLDRDGLRQYEQSVKKTKEIQTLEDVCFFLEQQYQALEAFKSKKYHNLKASQKQSSSFHISQKYCDFCKLTNHELINCKKFQAITIIEKRNFVKRNKLCYRCISHKLDKKCANNTENCKKCGKYHHTLLHVEEFKKEIKGPETTINMLTEQEKNPTVLLATAQIRVKTSDSSFVTLRALIDQGSQKTTISEEAAQILQLPRLKEKTELHGLGDTIVGRSKSKVFLEVRPRFLSNEKFMIEALVLNKLSTAIPDKSFKYNNDDWKNYILADPSFNKSDRIDMVLGSDVYSDILEEGIHKNDKILAQATKLGWILSGVLKSSSHKNKLITAMTTNLEKFWETEDMVEGESQSESDKCMEHYRNNTTREDDGKIKTKLPFEEEKQLGNSRKQAMARFLSLENKLDRNPELRKSYVKFMQEYINLHHMKEKTTKKEGKYYLPHQAVIREDSLTTKIRVVFDGSAKTSNGRSLNDVLLVGPRIQKDLFEIILKWRMWKYVILGDIEKMYRQINIAEEDQEYQMILWRENRNKPIKEYQLTTVTYGTACAPFLATMALRDIAERCEDSKISDIIKSDFYMDDLLTGADTIEECETYKLEVTKELKKYGFNLRKWQSNCKSLINNDETSKEHQIIQLEEGDTIKTLGLHWNPNTDEFVYKLNYDKTKLITKRQVLSKLAKIFDPLGWLTPITVRIKLFIQKLWLLNVDWDDLLNEELSKEWIELEGKLSEIEKIKVSRWIQIENREKWELHGFADASGKAFASVIYAKRGPYITILTAKSRVNPVKNRKTLPKLELCAANLLAKLMNKVINATNCNVKVFAWSDSTITLGWIQNNKSKNKFIKNKVMEIHKFLPKAIWNYVGSNENPADIASRGISPEKLLQFKLWWNGPVWLSEDSSKSISKLSQDNKGIAAVTMQKHDHFLKQLIDKISNYMKLVRIVAYVQRFAMKQKNFHRTKYLTVKELDLALQSIIRYQQHEDFTEEINSLRNNKRIDTRSKLATLNTFLDSNGILRVGGRLEQSSLTYDHKHPIVLQKSKLVQLLVEHIHKTTLHGGNRLMECTLRRNYWIIRARSIIKKCIRYCPRCIRYNQRVSNQIMGNLPKCRVTEARPFSSTGVDYAGPYLMKCSKGRGQKTFKGYVAVFVCMSTKAIHLEAVTDMTTESFLAALRRFFSRRGKCRTIYSDNGSNFVGASRKLDCDFKKVMQNNVEVAPILAAEMIEWKFIPPAAPHFGGIWESGVKSMKRHLNRVIGDVKLTYEEMSTLLAQIEAILNSRPLYALGNSPEDGNALTPAHFLIGHQIIEITETMSESNVSSLDKWKLIQKMKQDFWRQWKEEYLTTLQQRYKWKHAQENLKENQVVIIKNEVTHPCRWPLGKILEVHKGVDGIARVVTLKVQNGNIKRPIHKLCPLMTSNVYDDVEDGKYKMNMTKSSKLNNIEKPNVSSRKYLFILLLLIIMGQVRMEAQKLYGTIGAKVSTIDTETTMYFDNIGKLDMVNSKWNLVIYYELNSYFAEVSGIQTPLNELQEICPKLNYYEDVCKQMTNVMNQRYKTLKRNNDLLISHKRAKRAPFEFVGSLYHILFGMMDAEDKKQMEENMENLLNNQEDLVQLTKQQTSIINSTVNIVTKTKDEVNKNFQMMSKQLQQFYDDVSKTLTTERLTTAFQILVTQLFMMIDDCETTQISIINLLIDINHGHINPQLLQPAQLQQELYKIQGQLPEGLTLPGGSSKIPLKEVYGTLMAKGIILDGRLVIKAEIPLLNSESSDIYKIIPIPLSKGNVTIIPIIEADYIIFNVRESVYSMMSQSDLNSCKHILNKYTCNKNWAWIPAINKACEISALKGLQKGSCLFKQIENKNIWHKLREENRWLYKVTEHIDVEVKCSEGHLNWLTLPLQGILTLKSGCTARSPLIFLDASRQLESSAELTLRNIMWNKNMSQLTSWHTKPIKVHISNFTKIDDLATRLESLQSAHIELRQLRFHTISGHASLIIVIIIVIIMLALFIKIRCCKQKSRIQIDFTAPASLSGRQNVQI